MYIEEALIIYLGGYPGLSSLINNRLYPDTLQQSTDYPAVTIQLVSRIRDHLFKADSMMARSRYQFSIFATTRAETKAVAKQIRLALQNYSGIMGGEGGVSANAVEIDGEVDNFEADKKLYASMLDFLIWHEE